MKKKIIKLGVMVKDTVTEVMGMLTVYNLDMDGNELYLLQPAHLNPETQQPADRIWVTKNRINSIEEEVDLPLSILGEEAMDKATGFKGTIISLNYYINGCVHADIKPMGVIEKTGSTIPTVEFDIRRLEGSCINELSEEEFIESKKKFPSPETLISKSCR